MSFPRAPIVVFGTGGSGTRAIAELLHEAGVYLGPRLNGAFDSLVLKPFVRNWPERYLTESRWIEAMVDDATGFRVPPPDPAMIAELQAVLSDQRDGIPSPDALWGWKNPRTVYLLPALHQVLPEMACVQLVRDGRDMAYSQNQQQVEAYGELLVSDLASAPDPVRSIALWSRVNVAAARFGRARMADRHLLIRYEDLCAEPRGVAWRVLKHLEIPVTAPLMERAAELVDPSPGSGRWRQVDPAAVEALESAGAEGLREFGYAEA